MLLTSLLDTLEGHYGPQSPSWPTDPYHFLVWWHCGYPASDTSCAKGWESLKTRIGVEPDRLLAAKPAQLALALKPGGMVPELRGMRLQEIADRVQKEFGGDLTAALKGLSLSRARSALKKFPGIADPGADRILPFGGISPVAAVPSNCPHVLTRIHMGQGRENYSRDYARSPGTHRRRRAGEFRRPNPRVLTAQVSRTAALQALQSEVQHLSRRPILCMEDGITSICLRSSGFFPSRPCSCP